MTYVTSLSPDCRRRKSTDPHFIHPFRSLHSVNNGRLLKRLLININQRKILPSSPELIDRAVKHTSGDKHIRPPAYCHSHGQFCQHPQQLPSHFYQFTSHPAQLICGTPSCVTVQKTVSRFHFVSKGQELDSRHMYLAGEKPRFYPLDVTSSHTLRTKYLLHQG